MLAPCPSSSPLPPLAQPSRVTGENFTTKAKRLPEPCWSFHSVMPLQWPGERNVLVSA
jgi:hypothetical protein